MVVQRGDRSWREAVPTHTANSNHLRRFDSHHGWQDSNSTDAQFCKPAVFLALAFGVAFALLATLLMNCLKVRTVKV
jgi:hypothetical protein